MQSQIKDLENKKHFLEKELKFAQMYYKIDAERQIRLELEKIENEILLLSKEKEKE